ncbi:hypothetical protein Pint_10402 [Pistacia integerrima]|uniref:Uncharacterized protein n=1 Tax=Pistacia integerrima TaxID=434235 RepID=A0ACC0XK42_9ROSI|nr:hypothetical protein Pint_10402 [Pistacia integerrima]
MVQACCAVVPLMAPILLQKQSKQRRPRKMNKLEEMIPCLQQLGWEYQPKATGVFVVHCI